MSEDRCSWKYCRTEADQGIVVGADKHEYSICARHWFELCEMEGTTSENIQKHAKADKHDDSERWEGEQ